MYKLTVKPGRDSTLKIVTVFRKKEFYFFTYWDAVERVLCTNQYLNDHVQHYTSKYNIAPDYYENQLVKQMQTTL
ncbi:MAG: hypothetical protein EOP42_25925 [Sphingobacteriaceae bacterium]|nr:MAG: hypothetical protein EOP42_25925 [Sphingobacteriaceae bacterium]